MKITYDGSKERFDNLLAGEVVGIVAKFNGEKRWSSLLEQTLHVVSNDAKKKTIQRGRQLIADRLVPAAETAVAFMTVALQVAGRKYDNPVFHEELYVWVDATKRDALEIVSRLDGLSGIEEIALHSIGGALGRARNAIKYSPLTFVSDSGFSGRVLASNDFDMDLTDKSEAVNLENLVGRAQMSVERARQNLLRAES